MTQKLKFILSEASAFLLPFIKILLAQGGRLLMAAALEGVQAASTMKGASGPEKRNAAFEIVKAKLVSQGVEMAASVINSAIEAAVLKIKEN